MPISPGNNVVLNWTNPGLKSSITVPPGTSDNVSSSLVLLGQGFPSWAVPLQENLLSLLEHFASSAPPINPTKGQLWWDTSAQKLFVCYDPAELDPWREVTTYPDVFVTSVEPDPAQVGWIWYDPITNYLSLCTTATVVSPATPAVWSRILTNESIISATEPIFPRVDGQFWYDTVNRILFSWNNTSMVWQQLAPAKEIDVIGGASWNDVIVWINKIVGTPSNTLDNLDPYTEFNSWGYNQATPFGPYYSDVPSSQWLQFYDIMIKVGQLLGISTADLVTQDFHLPGQYGNQYGIPFMLDQWTKISNLIEQYKTGRSIISGNSLQSSNAIITYTGTVDAGSLLSVSSPAVSGFPAAETWTLTATSATNFTVTGSVSGAQAAATVDVAYDNGIIAFTINSGTNPFVAGDVFSVDVLTNLKRSYSTTWGAGDTGISMTFNAAFNDKNHQMGFFNSGGKLKIIPTFDDTTAGHNAFWNEFLTAVDNVTLNYATTSWGNPVSIDDPAMIGYYDLTNSWQTILYLDGRILPSGATRSFGYQPTFAAGTVTAAITNVGNGTVGAITGIDQDPLTSVSEIWTLTAIDATTFAVEGSTSGPQADLTVGSPYTNSYFSLTVTAGGTAFEYNDKFTFEISGVSNYIKVEAKLDNGGNDILIKVTLNDTTTVATDQVTTGGGLDGVVAQLHLLRASPLLLDNPIMPYPNITSTAWV